MKKDILLKLGAVGVGMLIVLVSVVEARGQEVGVDVGAGVNVLVDQKDEDVDGEVLSEEDSMMDGESMMGEEKMEEEMVIEEINYYLPYPGVLPDHPLYFLKVVRDRVIEWLTIDGVKKAELLTLYADKRLGAAKVLVEGGKEEMGVATLQKAAEYQRRAVDLVEELKEGGQDVGRIANQLERSSAKHVEITLGIKEKVGQDLQDAVNSVIESVLSLNERLQTVLERE